MQYLSCAGSVVLTQTHPAAPYVCRTGNISPSLLLPTHYSDSDHVVSPPVTCIDAVTVHLRSQCSGACSDVQETAEVQS